ncbi:MAG: EF-Tu/IF-2/RF-3 family GTPase [Patescibacteria group bacterium]
MVTTDGSLVTVYQVQQETCGLMAVGEVTNGTISKGDDVKIENGYKTPIKEHIKRIEFFHDEVNSATKGQTVGLCLSKISKDALADYLET